MNLFSYSLCAIDAGRCQELFTNKKSSIEREWRQKRKGPQKSVGKLRPQSKETSNPPGIRRVIIIFSPNAGRSQGLFNDGKRKGQQWHS